MINNNGALNFDANPTTPKIMQSCCASRSYAFLVLYTAYYHFDKAIYASSIMLFIPFLYPSPDVNNTSSIVTKI